MDALDILPVATAKNWLSVDVSDTQWDADIARLIKTAIDWVETYTCWRTYQRTETVYSRSQPYYNPGNYFPPVGSGEWFGSTSGIRCTPEGLSIYLNPFTITSVKDKDGNDVAYTVARNPLKTILYTLPNSIITLQTGFAIGDIGKIPQVFIDAALKMVIDLFETRDTYKTDQPNSINTLLNQYRRAII